MSKFTIDTSITFAARILKLVFGIGIAVVVARVLGPERKGICALAVLLPSLLVTFGTLGIGPASVFYIGKKKYSADDILGNNVLLALVLGIVGSFVGLIIIWFFGDSLFPNVPKMYIFLALLTVPLGLLSSFIRYFFLGLQRIKEFNLIRILQVFVHLLLVLILLLALKLGILAAIVANISAALVAVLAALYLGKKIAGRIHLRFNRSYNRDALRYGLKVYLGNVIGFLHYRVDLFLISFFLNPIAVGFYSIAAGLAEKIWFVSQSAGTVLFPRVSSETDEKRLKEFTPRVCRNILLISLMGGLLLLILGRLLIVFFFSEEYLASVAPLRILLLGAVTMSGWRVLANDLYGRGRPELNIYISALSVALNIILNILWIPKFGIAGAAWATSVSYTFAFMAITVVYARVSGNKIWKVILVQKADFSFYKNLLGRLM